MQNQPKTDQKKPSISIFHEPIVFAKGSSVLISDGFIQRDRDIDYLHTHQVAEIGFCKRGRGIWIIGDRIVSFSDGDVIYIDAYVPHLAQSSKGTTSEWIWLYSEASTVLPLEQGPLVRHSRPVNEMPGGTIYSKKDFLSVHSIITAIIAENSRTAVHSPEILDHLFRAIDLVHFTLSSKKSNATMSLAIRNQPISLNRVAPAIQYLSVHYGEKLQTSKLADLCCMSCTNFGRHFFRATNMSPRDYLMNIRMTMARIELASLSNRKILTIANNCGFPSISSFNRLFIRTFKLTPREYRKKVSA